LFGFEAGLLLAALGLDGVGYLVEADQREEIAVGILEAAENAAPDGRRLLLWSGRIGRAVGFDARALGEPLEAGRTGELDAAGAPLAELGHDVFGDERDVGVAADELVVGGVAGRNGEDQVGVAVGRRDHGPGTAGTIARVEDELKAEGVDVEIEAAFEITDEDADGLEAEEGCVERGRGAFGRWEGCRHGR